MKGIHSIYISFYFFLSFLFFYSCTGSSSLKHAIIDDNLPTEVMLDSVLDILDQEISHRGEFIKQKETGLSQLKSTLVNSTDEMTQFHLCCYLYKQYSCYQFDSAYVYAGKALEIAKKNENQIQLNTAQSLLMECYASVGMLKEGYMIMNEINPEMLEPDTRAYFYVSCALLHYNMVTFAGGVKELKEEYERKIIAYYDSALSISNLSPAFYEKFNMEKGLLKEHSPQLEIKLRTELLNKYEWPLRDLATSYLAIGSSYYALGYNTAAKYYMALSAICDLRFCNNETMASRTLAQVFHEEGNSERASKYIHLSLDEATFFNSRLRKMELNPILSEIESSRWLNATHKKIMAYVAAFIILLLLAIVVCMYIKLNRKNNQLLKSNKESLEKADIISRTNRELKLLNERLSEADEIKNKCIMESIYNNQAFAETVQKMCREIERKMKAKQFEDVIRMVNHMNIKDVNRRSLMMLDNIFLSIFPNFLEEFNKLLDNDSKVSLSENGMLPTEIRIYALQRLGISDTQLISKYLCISPNTIYVYKAKIKAHAIGDKEKFDEAVMAIPRSTMQ